MKQAKSNPVGWGPVASHWDETRSRVAKSMVFRSMTFFLVGKYLKVYAQYCSGVGKLTN